MNEVTSQLSNREIASLIWLGVLLVAIAAYRATRQLLPQLLRLIFFSKISVGLLVMLAYVSFVALIFHWLGFAHWWMLKDALFWFFGTAVILVFNTNKATEEKHHFKKLVLDTIKFAVVLSFILNLYTFSLAVELFLTLFLALVAVLTVVAEDKDEYKPAKKFLNGVLGVAALGLFAYTLVNIFSDPHSFASVKNLEDFLTPIVLTIALLPFLYGVALYSTYESLFVRMAFRVDDDEVLAYSKRQVILACRFRLRRVNSFEKDFVPKLGEVDTCGEVLDIVSAFKTAMASENGSE